jgi:endo-1,4-beta-xylanase
MKTRPSLSLPKIGNYNRWKDFYSHLYMTKPYIPMNKSVITICAGVFLTLLLSNNACSSPQNDEKNKQDEAIESIRKGSLHLKGEPGVTVNVEQLNHEFWFGCAIASQVFSEYSRMNESDINMYKEKFLENFNSAVTENAVKWGSMERNRGDIDYQTADNILDWTEENNIPCRGHNLYWGIQRFIQQWVKDLNDEELREALEKRGIETAEHYKGRFAEYDLNNEMIHGNYYAERLGDGITKEMAGWVLEGDEDAKLWLNDYDILTGNKLDDYLKHIRKLLNEGVPVSGIGVQGHLHGDSFSREKLKESLDSLGQFGLPIRITEFNFPGQRSKYYSICFAHPAVEGILMWGFWEGANWIGASSLYRRDWSPTPALKTYQDLIFNEWHTSVTVTLDDHGEAVVPAFYGDYKITSGQKEVLVSLEKEKGSKEVEF